MLLYRAMCQEEFVKVSEENPLNWKSRFKWFGTKDFVTSRVLDGRFNNSKFKDKYNCLCTYEVVSGIEYFSKCGYREFMLDRRKANNVKLRLIDNQIIERETQ